MKRAGFTVGPLIALVMVALLLAITIAGVATFHLTASNRSEADDRAQYLAEGALSQTLSQLHQGLVAAETGGQQFGRQGEVVVYTPYPERPDAQGVVSFARSSAFGYSTNNFDGTQGVGWNAIPVPTNTAHLIAQGTYGDATRTIEAFVSVPPYAFAVATQGGIVSEGPIMARAETSMATLAQNVANGTPNTTLPANVGSNGAISAGSGTDVTGDVVGPAAINLASPSTVGGALRSAHITLPTLNVTAYNNSALNVPTMGPAPALTAGTLEVQAPTYAPQSVVVAGNLQLDSVILYVDGDLTVQGGISGTGSVCVHGNVTVAGGANLSATNQVAMLSTGNVTLTGSSPSMYFQGLVYCEGSFSTSNITVAGAMIVAPNPSEGTAGNTGSSLNLGTGTQVVFVPTVFMTSASQLSPQGQAPVMANGVPFAAHYLSNAASSNFAQLQQGSPPPNPFAPNLVNDDTLPDATLLGSVVPAMNATDPAAAAFLNPSQNLPFNGTCLNYVVYPNGTTDTTHVDLDAVAVQTSLSPPKAVTIVYQTIEYNGPLNRFQAVSNPQLIIQDYRGQSLTVSQADSALLSVMAGGSPLSVQRLLRVMGAGQQAYMQTANQLLSQPPVVPNYYINNFLDDTTPLSILSWQVH